jgi:hypothetical protein
MPSRGATRRVRGYYSRVEAAGAADLYPTRRVYLKKAEVLCEYCRRICCRLRSGI